MKRHLIAASLPTSRSTPIGVAGRGIVAGLAGTLVLSLLSRILPGMDGGPVWSRPGESVPTQDMTLAPALTMAQSPGPEGLAEQFAYKAASGIFGWDLAAHSRLAGRVLHFAYGGAWGMLFGLYQSSYPLPRALAGAVYGVLVWLVGPVLLGPRMQLLEQPGVMPRERMTSLVAGHLAYGIVLAFAFDAYERKAR